MHVGFTSEGDADSDGGLRRRIGGTAGGQEEDVDTLLRHHNQMHEKLAEEMVFLAQSLKENVKAAGKIVRDDKEVAAEKSLRIVSQIFKGTVGKISSAFS